MIEVVVVCVEETKNIYYLSPNSLSLKKGDFVIFEDENGTLSGNVCKEKYMETEVEKAWVYETGTSFTLPDGRWCILFDFFGCEKEKMGYVPFISSKPGDMNVTRCPDLFSFPYGYKHGGVIEITDEEYERLKNM